MNVFGYFSLKGELARFVDTFLGMEIEVKKAANGCLSLKAGDTWLEDETDPVQGAAQFVSPERLQGVKNVVLFGLGLGYRVERLQRLGVENLIVFEPLEEVINLTKKEFPERISSCDFFSNPKRLLGHLATISKPTDKTILLAPPPYRRAFPKEHTELIETIKEAQAFAKLRHNSLVQRSGLMIENAVTNLPYLTRHPFATGLDRPLAGKPAFVVSAGPSLDKNIHLINEAAKRGPVIVVNTAAKAVTRQNCAIDVLVVMESLDVSGMISEIVDKIRLLAMPVTVNQSMFNLEGVEKTLYMGHNGPFAWLSNRLSIPPLGFGASVATAAFSLAYSWGASPIVLLGQDLAYTGGKAYAQSTPYEDLNAHMKGGQVFLEIPKEREKIFNEAGVKLPPKILPRISVPAWGGVGEVSTTHDMLMFKRWFELAVAGVGDTTLYNATEGGAHIQGFEEKPLNEILNELPESPHNLVEKVLSASPPSEYIVNQLVEESLAGAVALKRIARKCLKSRGIATAALHRNLRDASKKAALSDGLSAARLTEIGVDTTLSPVQKAKQTYEAIAAAASKVEEILIPQR